MNNIDEPDQLANKKILMVTPSLAALAFLTPLSLALHRAKANVHLASSSKGFAQVNVPPHIQFHDIDMQRGANVLKHFKAAQSLDKIVQKIKPDLVDAHYSAAMVTTAIARRSHWPASIATVQGLRFPHSQGIAKFIDACAEIGSAHRMDQVSILTQCDLKAAKRYFGKNFRLQESLGFGCNLERFNPQRFTAAEKSDLKEMLGLDPDTVICIYVGRYVKFKGFDIALRAFKEAREINNNLHLLLCGTLDPIHESGVTESELRDMNSDPDITDLGWTSDIEKYLSASDICIFPSEREGVPVSLMEAISMGVPVITADSRGCRDVVTDQVDGFVLPSGVSAPYTAKLLELADDKEKLKSLSKAAFINRSKFDSAHFALESMAQYRAHLNLS